MTDTTLSERQRARLAAAFRAAETNGLRLATLGRLAALVLIAAWVAAFGLFPRDWYYQAVVAGFAAIGLLQLWINRPGRRKTALLYALVLCDVLLMSGLLLLPNPLDIPWEPPGFQFHFSRFYFYFLLPVFMVLSFSPGLVLFAGAACCVVWSVALAWVMRDPAIRSFADFEGPLQPFGPALLDFVTRPSFIDVQARVGEMLVLLIVSALLAFAVHRMRRLVHKQAMTERARANLARYFSPKMVDELAAVDRPFAEVRTQTVAVLFADIVGFTRQCEVLPPAEAIALLREFHLCMEQAVYEFGGTLDKYLGDGVMATFGTPHPGPHDASNALACARAMLDRVGAWNRERTQRGLPEVRIGIGVHSGPVVLGDVGSDRHIEFAVIGDAVNVASRLEALTRDLGVDLVVSDALATLACAQGGDAFLQGFDPPEPQRLRGRHDPVPVRCFRQERLAA